MLNEWRMQLPKLVISVNGGTQKFELHPRIKEALSRGFVKAAVTTGAWIFTGGVNNGAAEHIGDALKEHASGLSRKVCTVGIAPWGVVDGRQDLIGQNIVAPYQGLFNPLSKLHVLNSLHSHFLLVDDGTVGRHGTEINIRKELENRICLQQIHARTGKRIPVVALILEGGPNTILTVFEYLQQNPPVPVVVCEGSGRAADLLAYVYKQTESQGNLLDGSESDVIATIKKTFSLNHSEVVHMFQTLTACMKTKHLITVFNAGPEEQKDIDVAILTSLLKSTNMSLYDQLFLALAWDRMDIAKNFIFVPGQQWLKKHLEHAMLDALVMDRVSFVKLLIDKGVSMHRFLTIPRLEELYNAAPDTCKDTLLHLIQDVKKGNLSAQYKITLLDVGLVIEYLMGGTYRCNYTKRIFRTLYKQLTQGTDQKNQDSTSKNGHSLDRMERKEKTRHGHFLQTAFPYKPKNDLSESVPRSGKAEHEDVSEKPFCYPFNELLVWAVLMKRQRMAQFFWQHGEESMAKALIARCLYREMSREARKWDIIDDTPEKLNTYSKEFGDLAVELLDKTYKQNERMTMKLLTYELSNWSKSTCLKLAVLGKVRTFISHACTQKLLTDMWMGRLNLRKNSWLKVILGILLPPIIPLFEYKTKAQMSHIPLSEDAHQMIQRERDEVRYREEGVTLGAYKESAFYDGFGGNDSEVRIDGKYQHLPLARKYFAFYHAPIVKFWFNTLAYLAFLMLYTYVVLVKMESLPSVQEWIVVIIILTTGLETVREIFILEAGKITQKLKAWFSSYLNINEFLGIFTFLVGFGLRFGSRNDVSNEDLVFVAGRLIYCLNTIFWFVKLLEILNVNQDAGPYVFIIGRMMSKMFFIIVIMGIVVISFGVPRQAILHPSEEPSWSLAQEIVFRPYWMTYGEMFAYEIDVCANDTVLPHLCGTGTWLNGFLQAVYVFVQYILMVNLLIAIFNNVYVEYQRISNHLWKFQRYQFIMLYQNKPVFPPPLILLSHIASALKWLLVRGNKKKAQGPKLYLTEDDKKRLHEFEEECVQIYFSDKKDHDSSKSDERIRVTSERVEDMLSDVKDVRDHVGFIKQLLHHLDDHIGHLQDLSGLTLDSMKTLTAQKALGLNRSHSIMSSDASFSKPSTDDGLGHSTMLRKSKPVWGRSLSQPGLEKYFHPKASDSRQKPNLAGTEFFRSDYHEEKTAFLDLQNRTLLEDKKLDSYQQQPLKISHLNNLEMPNFNRMTPKIGVTEDLSGPTHAENLQVNMVSAFPESSDTDQTKKEGFINYAFVDDRDKAFFQNGIKDSDPGFELSEDGQTKAILSTNSNEKTNQKGSGHPPSNKLENTLNTNALAGIFQKLWTKSKQSEQKLCLTKQDSGDGKHFHDYSMTTGGNRHSTKISIVGSPYYIVVLHTTTSRLTAPEWSSRTPLNLRFPDQLEFHPTYAGPPLPQHKVVNDFFMQQMNSCSCKCNFQLWHWQMIRDMCRVLRPFEEATRFVSQHNSSHSNEDNLRRAHSCTELQDFQAISLHASSSLYFLDGRSMSSEDLHQTDSKAALLKEQYYSRYSSVPKLSFQKEAFIRFGHDFKTSMDKSFYCSAIERNNLYRLSQSMSFTPLPPVGELVTVYRLEESSPGILNDSMSSWSHHGCYATIEILSKEEMGGGLKRAVKVACTWSENDILKAGHVYIIKSFLPEVVNTWSDVYKSGTILELCLREIQQQRAAQKLLFAFNQMKPKAIPYSPKFLEVFLLYCHSAGQWFTIEEYMAGRFRKYNNNTGNESVPSNKLEKTMLAFSHWTYEYTRGEFLVLDLQGVGETLTDPSVIKAGERRTNAMVFGPANLGDDAIKIFCTKHQCNSCCRHLKLPDHLKASKKRKHLVSEESSDFDEKDIYAAIESQVDDPVSGLSRNTVIPTSDSAFLRNPVDKRLDQVAFSMVGSVLQPARAAVQHGSLQPLVKALGVKVELYFSRYLLLNKNLMKNTPVQEPYLLQ
ncbi:transient receptor potential cation channel subfamily M member 7-like [Gastrophryne carolinensis]